MTTRSCPFGHQLRNGDDKGEGKAPQPANVASDLAVVHPYPNGETRVMRLVDRHDLAPHLIPRDYVIEEYTRTVCRCIARFRS